MRLQLAVLLAGLTGLGVSESRADVQRSVFTSGGRVLTIEALQDDIFHFEYAASGGRGSSVPIPTSPMVAKTDFPGAAVYRADGNIIESGEIRAEVDSTTLCVRLRDHKRGFTLSRICPERLEDDWKGLSLSREGMHNAYGLGQQFRSLGDADGDWVAHKVREGQPSGQAQQDGNGFVPFGAAGMVGNVQIPVLYALGQGSRGYALFLDNVYKQEWSFARDPWRVSMWGDHVRFYVMTGPNLGDLRTDFLHLTGRPPVPPRKAFGLWVSEFGYRNWSEIEDLRRGLRDVGFPVDGFVLDLTWFGGVRPEDPQSPMGRLDWDRRTGDGNDFLFIDPQRNLEALANNGVGIIAIEESYVSRDTDTFRAMAAAGTPFAYKPVQGACDPDNGDPVFLREWFGESAMVDWSDPQAGAWLHRNRRLPNLVSMGVMGHWTDLGEPEKYDRSACYDGVEATAAGRKNRHGDIHNIYNLLWNRSIYEGYVAAASGQRPFILSRSGAAGSQRFGVAMWSGDIGSNLALLATQANAQLHMALSGIDYYGADIGGFRREGMPGNGHHSDSRYEGELYTQWLANGAWFDVPVRPHTDNMFQSGKRYETAPHLVGHRGSNLANLQRRYALTPYYYSLAHRAFSHGEPVVAPLVYHFQEDENVRRMGHEKMVGRDILVGVVARHGEYERAVYLPAGKWVDFHSGEWHASRGDWVRGVPTYGDGTFRLPAFVREGAIVPMMPVDRGTRDAFGTRDDGTRRHDLVLRVYAGPMASRFPLIEDDGSTVSFNRDGRPSYTVRTTEISQQRQGGSATMTIAAASGTYSDAPDKREILLEWFVQDAEADAVTVDGISVAKLAGIAALGTAPGPAWTNAGPGRIVVKLGVRPVAVATTVTASLSSLAAKASAHFACRNGWTSYGETVAVVGNHPALGNGDPSRAVALQPSIYWEYLYKKGPDGTAHPPLPDVRTPVWTGTASELPPGQTIKWRCIVRGIDGSVRAQGPLRRLQLPARGGFAGLAESALP